MTQVKIYQPSKSTTQSGRAKIKTWLIEPELESKRAPEPLMGWTASGDTLNQVKLRFDTKEEAIEFATKKGWTYKVTETKPRQLKGRTYLDNFKYIPPQTKA